MTRTAPVFSTVHFPASWLVVDVFPACQNSSVAYIRAPELVLSLNAARARPRSYTRIMLRMTRVDLVVLEDWGLEDFSAWGWRDILEIIEPRSATRSTMIVSQLPVSAWHTLLGEGTIADPILDRIVHYGYEITLTGESRREQHTLAPIDQPQDPTA